MFRSFVIALFVALSGLIDLSGQTHAADKVDFDRDIAPVLRQHCVDCHGSDDQSGGLRLDRMASLSAETDSGKPALVPGNSRQSELIRRITSESEDLQMPPEGPRLSAGEIQRIQRWIDQGAAGFERAHVAAPGSGAEEGAMVNDREIRPSDHWAFQPIGAAGGPPTCQSTCQSTWPNTEIDRFIALRREAVGLSATADAAPAVLIRRATYALTGLPPTIDEVTRFQAAVESLGTETAMANLVDRLLSRPAYGERWGRHWMDWVRYADTAGDNSDYPIPQAYLYRNYIIDALNNDVPYDRFVTEQIAGDLLPSESIEQRNRQIIATGYLAMARRFGSLVERYPWHLTIEDTIDNIGRTMMGMTLSCARCHDHKFDPITMRDYYGLYGIFASTCYPFPGIELFKAQRDFVSLLDEPTTKAMLAQYQGETERLVGRLDDQLRRCREKAIENADKEPHCTLAEKRKMRDELDAMLIKARKAGEELAEHLKDLPEYPTAYSVSDGKPVNAAIQIKGEPARPGAKIRRGFPQVLGGWKLDESLENSTSGRLQLAQWLTHPDNPLTARVIVNRVWQRHFGSGIVASTSDFGDRGQPPSHPQLLDWLAADFVANGWSLKHLHRQIMTSRTYWMASGGNADNDRIDPDNRLLWRFNRQRLDAESIRDSVLKICGSLDPTPQTEPYPFPDRKKWSFTQHHPFKDDYPNQKRSVYQMTKRLTAKPYLQTFDGPDPNVCTSDRDQSVTALQALYFINDEFVHEQAGRFASQIIQHSSDPTKRIRFAVHSVLCRPVSKQETDLFLAHVQAVKGRLTAYDTHRSGQDVEIQAWSSLARSLFRLNEFLYLD